MSGHCKQVVEKYLELSGKDVTSLRQVATPCMDDHLILEEELKVKGVSYSAQSDVRCQNEQT